MLLKDSSRSFPSGKSFNVYFIFIVIVFSSLNSQQVSAKGELTYKAKCDSAVTKIHSSIKNESLLCNEEQNLVCEPDSQKIYRCDCDHSKTEFINVEQYKKRIEELDQHEAMELIKYGYHPHDLKEAFESFIPKCIAKLPNECENDKYCGPNSKCEAVGFSKDYYLRKVCKCRKGYRPYKEFICVNSSSQFISNLIILSTSLVMSFFMKMSL